jgi:hypothetical protein
MCTAVHEVCAYTLRHGPGHGTVHVWQTAAHVIVELYETGNISDPLAGGSVTRRIRKADAGSTSTTRCATSSKSAAAHAEPRFACMPRAERGDARAVLRRLLIQSGEEYVADRGIP